MWKKNSYIWNIDEKKSKLKVEDRGVRKKLERWNMHIMSALMSKTDFRVQHLR